MYLFLEKSVAPAPVYLKEMANFSKMFHNITRAQNGNVNSYRKKDLKPFGRLVIFIKTLKYDVVVFIKKILKIKVLCLFCLMLAEQYANY